MARIFIRMGSDSNGSIYSNFDGKYVRVGDSRSDGIKYNMMEIIFEKVMIVMVRLC